MGGFEMQKMDKVPMQSRQSRKKKKRRLGIRIDMTPMVDIAFLLLIFYMVTTVFSMPQSLELNLPPRDAEDILIAESRVLNLWVDADGKVYWLHNKSSEKRMELPVPIRISKLQSFLITMNTEIDKLITVLKIDPKCRYDVMVQVIDEIHLTERVFKQIDPGWSYRLSIDDITEWEIELMAKAREKS